ncbi:MAG: DUF4321 domain-containing protein [Firmicutes bacterium]|nr:DUF4321 domain-containing protein [Bacillota bacterium]
MRSRNGKSWLSFVLFLLAGIVAGGFLGYYLGRLESFQWLDYGRTLGLDPPFSLDIGIIGFSFGFTLKFNVGGVIGMVIAAIIHSIIKR